MLKPALKPALLIVLLLSLAACEHIDWRASARNLLEALCDGAEPCDVNCSEATHPGSGCT